jgi:hypothetical protein
VHQAVHGAPWTARGNTGAGGVAARLRGHDKGVEFREAAQAGHETRCRAVTPVDVVSCGVV